MKISKLFHWLYAVLMFLPIFAIGVTCAYVIFNKNAKDSFTVATFTANKSINIEFSDSINTYSYFNGETGTYLFSSATHYPNVQYRSTGFVIKDILIFGSNGSDDYSMYNFISGSSTGYSGQYNIYLSDQEPTISSGGIVTPLGNYITLTNNDSFFVQLSSDTQIKKGLYVTGASIDNVLLYTAIKPTLNDVFYTSLEQVINSDLFSWAYNSFLVTPFAYIVGLFSMPFNNPVVMLLSYWCAISIIWLVFDLIMYVPLLVHKWIDKAKVE